jgi:hypothetical protein
MFLSQTVRSRHDQLLCPCRLPFPIYLAYEMNQREVRISRGLISGYWKFSERHWLSTLHHSPSPPQLEDTLDDSWTALSIGWRYCTPFAALTSTSLSKPFQPAQADYGWGPVSSYTRSWNRILGVVQMYSWYRGIQDKKLVRLTNNDTAFRTKRCLAYAWCLILVTV